VVANVVIPSPDYVRFATLYRFRPDFCEGGDPESKRIVENLVGYAKSDLVVPGDFDVEHLEAANGWARHWSDEANARPPRRSARSRRSALRPSAHCSARCRPFVPAWVG
jgi:transposase